MFIIIGKMFAKALFVMTSVSLVVGQRPSFAGSRPIGYPEMITTTTEGLGNRFGEGDGTTVRLPIEANGDKALVDRLSKLPIDQQPFWFINWQAYEEHRKKPITYPQKPNVFIDQQTNTQNFNPNANNPSNFNPNANNPSNFNNNIPSFNTGTQPTQQAGNTDSDLNNRNLDSSDSLVPTQPQKINTQQVANVNLDKNIPEYIMVNGVLYRVVDSQSAPK